MYEFKLPDIGEGLHEAELLEWDVKVGDTVAEGDSIAQVSTDKVNVELPSPRAGVIAELPWKPGDVIPVGEVLARIDDGMGEAAGPPQRQPSEKERSAEPPAKGKERKRIKAAPAVRRYASEQGVDLAEVEATGPGGSVTKADIDAALEGSGDEKADSGEVGVTRVKLSGPRLAAAKRLEHSWRTLATSSLTFEALGDAVFAEVQRLSQEAGEVSVGPLAVIAKCVCNALKDYPSFNAVVDEEARALDVHDAIDLGIAVDGPDGLTVPVIRDAGDKSALDLALAIADRVAKVRAGTLAVSDFQGSTFTISSTGSLEKAYFTAATPVINFPNVATLWVSRIRQRPMVFDGELTVAPLMYGTLAFDHRFLHGADAMMFINTLTLWLQNPE